VDIIQYNAMHKFFGVLDNPRATGFDLHLTVSIAISYEKRRKEEGKRRRVKEDKKKKMIYAHFHQ